MKKRDRQNIVIGIGGAIIIGLVISYFYSAEQTRMQGYNFGNNLKKIQDELKQLQTDFDSKVVLWKEGEFSSNEFASFGENHVEKMNELISRYDNLSPPESFASSVDLFKLSAKSQLESDIQTIEWIKTGDENANYLAESLLQEAFEYEMAALAKFNAAKAGVNP